MFPYTDFQKAETITSGTWHISNGMWADLFICAPATANTLAKINAGISDNFLLSALLAARCPVILCPTMDEDMFDLDRFVDEQDRYSYDDSFDDVYDDEYGHDDREYDQ